MELTRTQKIWLILGIIFVLGLIGGVIYRYNWWTFVENYEQGYRFEKTTGKIVVLDRTGWQRITPMLNSVHTVDTRPIQIRIEANNRVLNAMLVRFKKDGLKQFIELHGRGDYDQIMLGDILKSYAYEGYGSNSYDRDVLQKKYKFLEILGSTSGSSLELPVSTLKDSAK